MSTPIVNGIIEIDGTAVAGVQEFSLDKSFDVGELRDDENPQYAALLEDQTSWSATVTADLRASEGTDDASTSFASGVDAIKTAAENRDSVTLTLTYGGQADFGDLQYSADVVEADAKITSISDEGDFFASGEAWTRELELQGEEAFTSV